MNSLSYEEFDAGESKMDSEYFGIPSAKVLLKKAVHSAQRQAELLSFMNQYDFVMITNQTNHSFNNQWLGENTKAFLADTNIKLQKKVSKAEKNPGNVILICDDFPQNSQIIRLAETSFRYSRFLNDPYLNKEKARTIYGDMVNNSFCKPGRYFITYRSAENIIGFLLFSFADAAHTAKIEFLAVDTNHQGSGIGKALIQTMDHFLFEKKVEQVVVGTQLNNIEGIRFYLSAGFKLFECNTIFHYWPSKAKLRFTED